MTRSNQLDLYYDVTHVNLDGTRQVSVDLSLSRQAGRPASIGVVGLQLDELLALTTDGVIRLVARPLSSYEVPF